MELKYLFTTDKNKEVIVSPEDYDDDFYVHAITEDNVKLVNEINQLVSNLVKPNLEKHFNNVGNITIKEFKFNKQDNVGSFILNVDGATKKTGVKAEAELIDFRTRKRTQLQDPEEEKCYHAAKLHKEGDSYKIDQMKIQPKYFNDATVDLVEASDLFKVDGSNEILTILKCCGNDCIDIFQEDRKIIK